MRGEEPSELVDRLAGIGLDEREARLYVNLCLRGPARASEAAAAARLKRTETYRALEGLMRRGFVHARLSRPVVYEAVSPDVVFSELLAHHEQRRAEIESLRERVQKAIEEKQAAAEGSAGRHGYKIIQGRRAILGAVESMLRQAQEGQSMASTYFAPQNATSQNRAYQMTLRRAQEGFPMRLLLRDAPGLERALQPLLAHPNVRVRFFSPPHPLRFTIVDGREILTWLVNDPSPALDARDDVAMWTNAPDFVQAQQTLYEALWASGREAVRPQPAR